MKVQSIKYKVFSTGSVPIAYCLLPIVYCLLFFSHAAFSQPINSVPRPQPAAGEKPKLIVGIVVDQMRYDYLFRFKNKYGEDGFKRLLSDGFSFSNANYNYVPTYTAPGHACIYTGTTPSYNGIISNDWFDPQTKKAMYCVSDSTVQSVGTTSVSGKMSPKNLLTTTVTDELRLSNNFKSKVIGIALKDRGAILPAGHTANAAYWHDSFTNNFVSSSYYMKELPQWMNDFNARKLADSLTSKPWETAFPLINYTECTADSQIYEGMYKGEMRTVFPHNLPLIKAVDMELIRKIPMGNTFTKEAAVAALQGERLGKGTATDFLAVSFSSTDYVGHQFGSNSVELEDTYIRLDRDIASLLAFIDSWVGKENALVFLTADHGAANNPTYNNDEGIPAGNFNEAPIVDSLKKFLNKIYGDGDYLLEASAHNISLDHDLLSKKNISSEEIEKRIANFVMQFEGVACAMTAEELKRSTLRTGIASFIQNGYNAKRSPDVFIELAPAWMDWGRLGTTHGSSYSYDTHVPVIFCGWKVTHGTSALPVSVTDIAPTLSTLLNIEFPNGNSGRPLPLPVQ